MSVFIYTGISETVAYNISEGRGAIETSNAFIFCPVPNSDPQHTYIHT
jgi:hypothetical protein